MRILALGKKIEQGGEENFEVYLKAEARVLWDWYTAGVLRSAHYCPDWDCALLTLECADAGAAAEFLKNLPSVKAKLFRYELTQLKTLAALAEIFVEYNAAPPDW